MKYLKQFLMLCLLWTMGIVANAHDFEAKNADGVTIYYKITSYEDRTVAVTYEDEIIVPQESSSTYTNTVNLTDKVVHSSIEYSVTSIGDSAFFQCQKLKKVTIPNSIISIGKSAFFLCKSLESVVVPNSVKSIGFNAFSDCSSLMSISVESGNTIYDSRNDCNAIIETSTNTLIYGCNTTAIPNTVTTIDFNAFEDCPNMSKLTIPSSVIFIRSDFKGCTGLESIVVETGNTKYDSRNDCNAIIVTSSNTLFKGCKNTIIPSSISKIGSHAFEGCTEMTSITIPNSVTIIGDDVFQNCSDLTSIEIPNSVTSIGCLAFNKCTNLQSVIIGNSVKSIGHNAFSYCTNLTSIDLPSSITSIEYSMFSYCSKLSSVTIPSSVSSIGSGAFFYCSKLSSVTIPSSVSSIGSDAFSYCKTLSSITIPSSVISIEKNAFLQCKFAVSEFTNQSGLDEKENNYWGALIYDQIQSDGLCINDNVVVSYRGYPTSITIPSSVTGIGEKSLSCSSLTDVTVDWTDNIVIPSSNAFYSYGLPKLTLHVPVGCRTKYLNASVWKDFGIILEVGDVPTQNITFKDETVKAICVEKLDRNKDGELSEQEAADATNIYRYFKDNTTITSFDEFVYFTGIEALDSYGNTFSGCTALKSIILPNSVKSIYRDAFMGCSSLESIVLSNSVVSITGNAFSGCSNLTSINIPNSVKNISGSPFVDCINLPVDGNLRYADTFLVGAVDKSLNTYTIKDGTKWIGDNAFSDCSNLTTISIPNSVFEICQYAFSNCSNLKSAVIPESVTTIGGYAFSGCSNMATITLPDSLILISSYTFKDCYSLESITIPDSVQMLIFGVFQNCSKLSSIYIPKSVYHVSSDVFVGCTNLSSITVSPESTYFDSRDDCNAIISKSRNTLVLGCKNTTIPSSVTSIHQEAFQDCTGLQSISLSNNITSIGTSAFSNCNNLKTVIVGSSVNNIGKEAFSGCSAITSFTLQVVDPSSITLGEEVFKDVPLNLSKLYVPAGSKELYEAANVWKNFGAIVEISPAIDFANLTVKSICILNWDKNKDGNLSEEEAADVTSLDGKFKDNTAITSFAELSYFTGLTAIGEGEFSGCTKLETVALGSAVNSIGKEAFAGCTALKSFTSKADDPSSITLGEDVWKDINLNLAVLHVPAGKKAVYKAANQWKDFGEILGEGDTPSPAITFVDDNIKGICVTNWDKNKDGKLSEEEAADVTSLEGKFKGNTAITSFAELSYFTGLTSFVEGEFSGCTSLASISIPTNITVLPPSVFSNCGFTSFVIPDNITTIGASAFSGCASLETVALGSAVNSIGKEAFAGCNALKSFTSKAAAPSSITLSADVWKDVNLNVAVLYVPAGKKAVYKAANQWKNFGEILGEGDTPSPAIVFADVNVKAICIDNWDKNEDGNLSEEEASDVTSLNGKFKGDTTIKSFAELSYFTGLTAFGEGEFSGCSSLTSVTIPSSITVLPTSVFSGSGFASYVVPDNITSIGESAFSGCTSLASVTLGSAVNSIGKEAFAGCTVLNSFTSKADAPSSITLGADVWKGDNLSVAVLHVPAGKKMVYKAADQWKNFGLILGEGDSPTPNITFADTNVKAVCVTNWDKNSDGEISQEEAADVTSLDGKFKDNTTIASFNELSYFTGLTSFGAEEFSGCSSLATITIPSKFTALPTSVFSGCGFTSFTIPNNITTIGESAFSGCTKLVSVTLGSGVNSIGNYAFKDCTGLTSFTTNVVDPAAITLGSDVWKNVNLSNVPLTAPNAESLKKYSTAAQWSAFKYDFPKEVSFDENSDITSQLEELVNEGKRVDFTINRTFYCDGYFNTICLPFSMTEAEIAASPIGGYKELKKFVKAEVKGKKKDEMNVNVGLSATKTIEAGVPYFISWHKGANIVNPTFENVLVTEFVGKTISGGGMSCIGILTPTVLDPTVNNLLFLGEANWLYWSNDMTPLKAFRAYFSVNPVSMVNFRKDMPAYFVDMDNVTGIETIVNIESRPVKYLENGKVVIEKNGVKYDTMGRVIK